MRIIQNLKRCSTNLVMPYLLRPIVCTAFPLFRRMTTPSLYSINAVLTQDLHTPFIPTVRRCPGREDGKSGSLAENKGCFLTIFSNPETRQGSLPLRKA